MIAREGSIPLVAVGLSALVVSRTADPVWSAPIWLLLLFLFYLYREPRRVVTSLPLAVVSPVDGRVDLVEEAFDPWLDRRALRVGIALLPPGVTLVRSPVEGKMQRYWTDLEATAGAAARSESPTTYAMWLKTDAGDDVVYSVSSRRPHSRFKTDVAPGERTGKGQRGGFVYFASRIDVLMPVQSKPEVETGEKVVGGAGVIATLYRK